MTPDESQLLRLVFGSQYLQDAENLSISIFFYGIFVVLFSASVVFFMRRRFSNRATVVLFVATGLCFLLATLYIGTFIEEFVQVIRKTLVDNTTFTLPERMSSLSIKSADIILNWSTTLPILLSDLIIIWRASVLFPDQRWVIIWPFLPWLATAATSATFLIWLSTPSGYDSDYLKGVKNGYSNLSVANLGLSIGTNAIATAMIAYKLWTHRTVIVKNLGLKGQWKSPAQKILILLVESGLVYLVFQIVALALDIAQCSKHELKYEAKAFSHIYLCITQTYPTIVILVVETQRSMAVICGIDPCNADVGLRAVTPDYPSFSVGSGKSATDSVPHPPSSRTLQSHDGHWQENWKAV